jgi:DNA mismatch repair protein MSH5
LLGHCSCRSILTRIDQILQSFDPELASVYGPENSAGMRLEYFSSFGFLLSMDSSVATATRQPNVQFISGDRAHCKTQLTDKLDADYGDLHATQCAMEVELLQELHAGVLAHTRDVLEWTRLTAQFDVLIAFANAARNHAYVRPEMLADGRVFVAQQARHPLQEIALADDEERVFVPTDITLDEDVGSLMLLTGPNYSGKSVLIKTLGLVVYMAQIGSFVPADAARLSLVDRLFTRIESRETSAAPFQESRFTIQVRQVATMLRNCTTSSLLLIDEFGKATNSVDGRCLLASTLRFLVQHGPPRTAVCTHFNNVLELVVPPRAGVEKDNGAAESGRDKEADAIERAARAGVCACQMAVEFTNGDPVPLFRLTAGLAKESFGIICAERCGVLPEIVQRAKQVLAQLQ